jgi:hypothetical protein
MTITIVVPLAFCIVGALVYGLVPGKGAELGRLAFLAGIVTLALHVEACRALHF